MNSVQQKMLKRINSHTDRLNWWEGKFIKNMNSLGVHYELSKPEHNKLSEIDAKVSKR